MKQRSKVRNIFVQMSDFNHIREMYATLYVESTMSNPHKEIQALVKKIHNGISLHRPMLDMKPSHHYSRIYKPCTKIMKSFYFSFSMNKMSSLVFVITICLIGCFWPLVDIDISFFFPSFLYISGYTDTNHSHISSRLLHLSLSPSSFFR